MMRAIHLSELCEPLQARLVGEDTPFDAVTTDSRSVTAGALFVALRGENFDGHDILPQVHAASAGAALDSHQVDVPNP